ncbi:MAG: TetR/AcrR family transcriptional regulator [Planctomycetes bacterium]|nr:TetR/AcrR family transcriptional regulator [Planctomycetota bacterium]
MNDRSSRRTFKQRQKEACLAVLVEAAETVIYREGYHQAHMQQIAREAGCAAGTLYLYFKSKEELYQAMVTRHTEAITDQLRVAMATKRDPVEQLKAKTVSLLDYFNRHRAYFRVSFTEAPGGRADIKSNLRDRALKAYLEFKKHELATIKRAQKQGLLRTDLPAEELVEFVHGTTASTLARWSAQTSPPRPAAQLRYLWGFLQAGLGIRNEKESGTRNGKGNGHR